MFITSSSFTFSLIFNRVVIIFSGVFEATSSMSIPPSALEIKAIFELARSTKHDK